MSHLVCITLFGETDNVTLSRLGCVSRRIYPPQNIIWICGKVYSRRIFPPQKFVGICGPMHVHRYLNFVFPLKQSHAIEWPLKTRLSRFFFFFSLVCASVRVGWRLRRCCCVLPATRTLPKLWGMSTLSSTFSYRICSLYAQCCIQSVLLQSRHRCALLHLYSKQLLIHMIKCRIHMYFHSFAMTGLQWSPPDISPLFPGQFSSSRAKLHNVTWHNLARVELNCSRPWCAV